MIPCQDNDRFCRGRQVFCSCLLYENKTKARMSLITFTNEILHESSMVLLLLLLLLLVLLRSSLRLARASALTLLFTVRLKYDRSSLSASKWKSARENSAFSLDPIPGLSEHFPFVKVIATGRASSGLSSLVRSLACSPCRPCTLI